MPELTTVQWNKEDSIPKEDHPVLLQKKAGEVVFCSLEHSPLYGMVWMSPEGGVLEMSQGDKWRYAYEFCSFREGIS